MKREGGITMKRISLWYQHNFRPLHLVGRIVWKLPAPWNMRAMLWIAHNRA
jgi:hypothetical protein